MSASKGFLNENERCPECGMFGEHDIICPHNPALRAADPQTVLIELEAELAELECIDCPDFEAIADLAARIESIRSHVSQH